MLRSIAVTQAIPVDDAFWAAFADRHFEREAFAIERIAEVPVPIDAASLFAATCATGCDCPAARRDRQIQVYVDGVRVPLDGLIPIASDGSLIGYDSRIRERLGDRSYLLRMEKLHAYYPPLWEGAHALLAAAIRHVGMPPGADTATFIGRYRQTPAGVHADNLSSLTFPIIGEKSMRIWPSSYVKANPDLERSRDYAVHLGASRLVAASPGGLVYWPSDSYHIGESPDLELRASLSVGLWVNKHPLGLVLELLGESIATTAPEACGPIRCFALDNTDRTHLPTELDAILSVLRAAVGGHQLEDAMMCRWLEMRTDLNLKRFSATVPVELTVDDRVSLYPRHPIITRELRSGALVGSSRGAVFAIPSRQALAALDRLDSTESIMIGALVEGSNCPDSQLVALISKLVQLDVVRRSPLPGQPDDQHGNHADPHRDRTGDR